MRAAEDHGSNVPRWCGQPGLAAGSQRLAGGVSPVPVHEEAVRRRTRAAHVRAKDAERAELLGERGRDEVVRWELGEVGRTRDAPERLEQRLPACLGAVCTVPRVE